LCAGNGSARLDGCVLRRLRLGALVAWRDAAPGSRLALRGCQVAEAPAWATERRPGAFSADGGTSMAPRDARALAARLARCWWMDTPLLRKEKEREVSAEGGGPVADGGRPGEDVRADMIQDLCDLNRNPAWCGRPEPPTLPAPLPAVAPCRDPCCMQPLSQIISLISSANRCGFIRVRGTRRRYARRRYRRRIGVEMPRALRRTLAGPAADSDSDAGGGAAAAGAAAAGAAAAEPRIVELDSDAELYDPAWAFISRENPPEQPPIVLQVRRRASRSACQ
jgi:hypothetical protein